VVLDKRVTSKGYGQLFLDSLPECTVHKGPLMNLPNAAREWGWQYVFPARDLSTDPRSGIVRRHHLDEATINKAIKAAVDFLKAEKKAGRKDFKPGDRIPYAGRVYDEKEMANLIDASLDFWLTAGRYADFHALRHTTGSLLAASGAHPKVAILRAERKSNGRK
jgi:hypothetical protein